MSSNKDINDITDGLENITNIQETQPQKIIIFCISGDTFSSRFLLHWSELLLQCIINNYRPILCQEHDNNLFISRNKCLGANILEDNKEQLPFQGNIKYDYLVWINPKVTYTFNDLKKLLDSQYEVTSGVYIYNGANNTTNVVQKFDYEFYKKNGTFNFENYDNLINLDRIDNRYFEADFVDIGLLCMKYGVAEKIKYPWFDYCNDEPVNLFTDSYSYCKKLKAQNIKIMVDTNIKLQHF
jgi:hypothetical protein|tara:strand:- start:1387 stop:2106 length:720 start_codon:yes stop_codon:yes gene_type:complete